MKNQSQPVGPDIGDSINMKEKITKKLSIIEKEFRVKIILQQLSTTITI